MDLTADAISQGFDSLIRALVIVHVAYYSINLFIKTIEIRGERRFERYLRKNLDKVKFIEISKTKDI